MTRHTTTPKLNRYQQLHHHCEILGSSCSRTEMSSKDPSLHRNTQQEKNVRRNLFVKASSRSEKCRVLEGIHSSVNPEHKKRKILIRFPFQSQDLRRLEAKRGNKEIPDTNKRASQDLRNSIFDSKRNKQG